MGVLTPSDVKRWDLGAIRMVFEAASGRAATLRYLGENLSQVHDVLSDWQGEAGEAFRADLGKARHDIEADGAESKQVAAAVSHAEADVSACKRELDDVERAAGGYGWTITPDWRIDVGDTGIGLDPLSFAAAQQALQDDLNGCKVHAHNADHELAAAINAAVGEAPADGTGNPPSGAVPPRVPANLDDPQAKPSSLEDMLLLRTGPGGDDPARVPQSLEDMLLPAGPAAGAGAPVKPSDAEIRAVLRRVLVDGGTPPDQIEAQLNAAVARAQNWFNHGGPQSVPSETKRPPPPGFADGFADHWDAAEQGIKTLFGQGGPGAPGVLESWTQLLKGTAETATNPAGVLMGEVQNAINSPSLAYYFGGKTSDGAFLLPGLLFGGEAATVEAALPAETVTEGGAPLAVVRGWDPMGGMSLDDFASQFGTTEARNYPLNDGFPPGYVPQPAHLPEGTIIDRFGSELGRYFAPDGTPFADRALAPESVGGNYNRYIVTGKQLPGWEIVEGPVEPFYGQTPSPGALQYTIIGPAGAKVDVEELVDRGILDEYGPRLGR